eukprot:gene9769-11407_t
MPDTVTSITFGALFNQPIQPGSLPKGLTSLTFGDHYNQPLKVGALPPTLTSITLGKNFDQQLSGDLPSTLQFLIISLHKGFNDYELDIKFPLTLAWKIPHLVISNHKILSFGPNFNQPLQPGVLPSSLVSLAFGDDFDQELQPGVLPIGISTLVFGTEFNQPIKPGDIPHSVTTLELGTFFDQPLQSGWLTGATTLSFGYSFNQPLRIGDIPPSITTLSFAEEFNQPFQPGVLPAGLVSLSIGDIFNHPILPGHLPSTLEHFKLYTGRKIEQLTINSSSGYSDVYFHIYHVQSSQVSGIIDALYRLFIDDASKKSDPLFDPDAPRLITQEELGIDFTIGAPQPIEQVSESIQKALQSKDYRMVNPFAYIFPSRSFAMDLAYTPLKLRSMWASMVPFKREKLEKRLLENFKRLFAAIETNDIETLNDMKLDGTQMAIESFRNVFHTLRAEKIDYSFNYTDVRVVIDAMEPCLPFFQANALYFVNGEFRAPALFDGPITVTYYTPLVWLSRLPEMKENDESNQPELEEIDFDAEMEWRPARMEMVGVVREIASTRAAEILKKLQDSYKKIVASEEAKQREIDAYEHEIVELALNVERLQQYKIQQNIIAVAPQKTLEHDVLIASYTHSENLSSLYYNILTQLDLLDPNTRATPLSAHLNSIVQFLDELEQFALGLDLQIFQLLGDNIKVMYDHLLLIKNDLIDIQQNKTSGGAAPFRGYLCITNHTLNNLEKTTQQFTLKFLHSVTPFLAPPTVLFSETLKKYAKVSITKNKNTPLGCEWRITLVFTKPFLEFLERLNAEITTDHTTYTNHIQQITSNRPKSREINSLSSLSLDDLDLEIDNLDKEEIELMKEYLELEEQKNDVIDIRSKMDDIHKEIKAEERVHYDTVNHFYQEYFNLLRDKGGHETQLGLLREEIENLTDVNIVKEIFQITFDKVDEHTIVKINDLRLGTLPKNKVEWDEINGAMGQIVLLVHTITKQLNISFSQYKLIPMGNKPLIQSKNDKEAYPLYGGDEIYFRTFIWSREHKFDVGMEAFLGCVNELCQMFKTILFPFKIEKDKIGGKNGFQSIRVTGNTEVNWTKALNNFKSFKHSY